MRINKLGYMIRFIDLSIGYIKTTNTNFTPLIVISIVNDASHFFNKDFKTGGFQLLLIGQDRISNE